MRIEGKFILFSREEFMDWLNGQKLKRKISTIQNHHTYIPNYSTFKGQNHFQLTQSMEKYHMKQANMSEIAQNITTYNDGAIMLCRALEKDPGCFLGPKNNVGAICIEHVGNFDLGKDIMTDEHRKTIVFLNALICLRFSLMPSTSTILYHHFVSEKSCPGTNFFGGNTKSAAEKNFIPLVMKELKMLKAEKIDDAENKEENKEQNQALKNAVNYLEEIKVIDSPNYWINNAVEGKTVKGDFVALLIIKATNKMKYV